MDPNTNHPFAGAAGYDDTNTTMPPTMMNPNDNENMMMMNHENFSSSFSAAGGMMDGGGVDPKSNEMVPADGSFAPNHDANTLDAMTTGGGHNADKTMGEDDGGENAKDGAADNDNDDEENAEIDETWNRWKDDAGNKLQTALEDYKGHTKRLFSELEAFLTKLASVDKSYASVQRAENEETARLDQVAPDVEGATAPVLQHQQQQHHG